MDFAHLVHALARRTLRSPVLHCAGAGAVLFGVVSLWQPTPSGLEEARIVVPAYRIEAARQEVERDFGRALTANEERKILDTIVDQEVLYAYALQLGIDKEPVAERRLAQIARFVTDNPHEQKSESELVTEARDLGLHQGDLVVRRILIDGARRLIRAGALIREPSEEMLTEYLIAHPQEFRTPAKLRLSHVFLSSNVRGDLLEADARELLARLQQEQLSPEDAAGLGDPSLVSNSLPAMPQSEIERRFGYRFARALSELESMSWQGPVRSRYGLQLVFIHERIAERTAELAEVRKEVRAQLRQQLADDWLAFRLTQLRAKMDIEVQGAADSS